MCEWSRGAQRRLPDLTRAAALAAATLLGVSAGCGDGGPGRRPADPPNVVIVVMDTTRADRCSINGYARPTTPNLARLAEEGTVFRDCWSPSPWTGPAHASLFTGNRPARHGFSYARALLPPEETLLAEHLKNAGWSTGCFSANTYVSPEFGLTQGFRRYDSPSARLGLPQPTAAVTHEAALDWALGEHARGRRFFLFVNDMEPHGPYTPEEPFGERFAPGLDPALREAAAFLPPAFIAHCIGLRTADERVLAAASDLYDAEIAALDAQIGLLLDRLRAAGALDDTVVVVTGDHGENLGEHGLVGHIFSSHRTLLHVPLLVRYPPAIGRGRVVDDVVRLEDVFPTVLELCGLPVPEGIDGVSLLAPLGDRIARATDERPVGSLANARAVDPGQDLRRFDVSYASAYDGHHHLIRASDGREWLYDVREDPLEERDISRREPGTADRLRSLLDP